MRALITGAAGFIGSHLVEHLLRNTDWELVLLDKLSYASSGLARLRDVQAFEQRKNRVSMFPTDISLPIPVMLEKEFGSIDYILHLAAETHVDNSISDPRPFVMSNVVGTMEMLQFARRLNSGLKRFLYFSTDEVFGPAHNQMEFSEWDRYNSTNPYSASKAAGEELCLAWANTYGIPMLITHCMNAFGERQHPEKFIPNTVRKLLRGETVKIHSNASRTTAGSRSYIHCRNIASGLQFLLEKIKDPPIGKLRDKYNITGELEVDNLQLAMMIAALMETELNKKFELRYEMVDFHGSRPGHDLRYALSGKKMEDLGWAPPKDFGESLQRTVRWMVNPKNIHWLFQE